jgi:hypothetical protein
MAEVLFAAYGDIEEVLPVLLGRELAPGRFAMLHNVELCIQGLDEVPDNTLEDAPAPVSPRTVLSEHWDGTFRTYAVREAGQLQVPAHIHNITEEEREIILAEWNLRDFGWFHDLSLEATTLEGDKLQVVTDAITVDQVAQSIPCTGDAQQPSLNGARSREVAGLVREDYLQRAV